MGSYRDRLQIIADILSIVSRKVKKTRIMYQANLSYKLLCRYLEEVLDAGLIDFERGDCYVLTAKGKEFLNRHQEYSKQCDHLKEQMNNINSNKVALENLVEGNLDRLSNEKLRNKGVK